MQILLRVFEGKKEKEMRRVFFQMVDKRGGSARDDLCVYVLCSGMDGAHAGSRRGEFHDYNGDRGADRGVRCYKDDREYF